MPPNLANGGRLICWGGGDHQSQDSFRWVWQSYHEAANKLGIPTVWTADSLEWHPHVFPGDTVLGVDVWSQHIPYVKGARYILHNFLHTHPLVEALEGDFLRLQVWTTDAFGEQWAPYRQFDHEAQVLFQPWGTEILSDDFMEPVFNPESREVVFVGAVWSDVKGGVELGNEAAIQELRDACDQIGLTFVHRSQITAEEKIQVTREALLAPVVVGGWQCEHGYLPCRAFNSAAYGVPVLTNSPFVADLFGHEAVEMSVGDLLEEGLSAPRSVHEQWVREDQEIASKYTYSESIAAIDRAFEEIQS